MSIKYIEELQNNPYVREKDLGNNIHSFNYSHKAFWNKVWNNITERARGFFVDVVKEKVVARSFDKFFAIGEHPETQLQKLKESLVFPVEVYLKENGFLGICAYDSNFPDNLFLASKSTNQGEYAEYFKSIFYQYFEKGSYKIEKLAEFLKSSNVSLVFEVIDPIHDPHIVEYSNSNLVLLAIIYNDFTYKQECYEYLKYIADTFGIPYKQKIKTLYSWDEFKDFVIKSQFDRGIEGYVLEDFNGFMLKLKTNWYKYWKRVRTIFQAIKSEKYTDEQIEKKYHISFSNNPMFQYMKLSEAKNIIEFRKSFIDRKKNM